MFDVDSARQSGYTDDEIAQYLAGQNGFDYAGAVKSGYSPTEIVDHLSHIDAPPAQGQEAFLTPPSGPTSLTEDQDTKNYRERPFSTLLSKTARSVLQAGGATAGAIAGTVGEPGGGTLVGGGLGYGAGEHLADLLDEYLGFKQTPGVVDRLKKTASDVLTGAGVTAAGEEVAPILSKVLSPFASSMTSKAKGIADLANENNVPLTPAEITKSRPLAQLENFLRAVPGSAGKMQDQDIAQGKALTKLAQEVQGNVGEAPPVDQLGGKIQSDVNNSIAGNTVNRQDALNAVREEAQGAGSFPKATSAQEGEGVKQNLKEASKLKWGEVGDEYANLPIQPGASLNTKALADKAEELLGQYSKKSPAFQDSTTVGLLKDIAYGHIPPDMQNVLDNLGNAPGEQRIRQGLLDTVPPPSKTWEEIKTLRSDLNQKMTEEDQAIKMGQGGYKGLSSSEGGVSKQLKKTLDSVIEQYSNQTGGTLKPAFDEATANAKEFYTTFGDKNIKQVLNSNPEKIFKMVMKPGATTQYNMLKKAVGEDGVRPLKDMLTSDIVGNGDFSGNAMAKKLSKYGDEMLGNIYGSQGLADLKDLATRAKAIEDIPVSSPLFDAIAKKKPEEVFDSILRPASSARTMEQVDASNVSKLKELAPVIGNEGMSNLKSKLAEKLLQYNSEGTLLPDKFVKMLNSYGPRTAQTVFGDDIKQINDLATLAKASSGASKIAANPSGTGQSVVSAGYLGLLVRSLVRGSLHGLSEAVLLPRGLAKLYLSPAGRKYLTEGFSTPTTNESSKLVGRILSIAGVDGYKQKPVMPQPQNNVPKAPVPYENMRKLIGVNQ